MNIKVSHISEQPHHNLRELAMHYSDATQIEQADDAIGGKHRVCVVMPAYKSAETILAAIDSILSQEIDSLVIGLGLHPNDSETLEVVNKIDGNIKIILQDGRGISNGRNVVLKNVDAEFFLFLDSDDILLPGVILNYLQAAAQFPEAALFYANWVAVLPNKDKIFKDSFYTKDGIKLRSSLLIDNFISTSGTFVRSDAVKDIGLFNESYSHAEDWEYWNRILQKYSAVKLNMTAMYYRHTKLGALKDRAFWFQEATILKSLSLPKSTLFLSLAMTHGRYAIYYFRTMRLRKGLAILDIRPWDLAFMPLAIGIKLLRKYVYRFSGSRGVDINSSSYSKSG